MFKWTRRRPSGHPSTPKLTSVSLPEETSLKRVSTSQWLPDLEKKAKITSAYSNDVPVRRSKTPHPISSKVRQDVEAEQESRTRTVSLTAPLADGFLKPPKSTTCSGDDIIKPVIVPPFKKEAPVKVGQTDHCGGPHKSILKNNVYSHNASNTRHLENVPPPPQLHAGHFGKHAAPPSNHRSSHAGHSRHDVAPPNHPSLHAGHPGRYGVAPSNHHTLDRSLSMSKGAPVHGGYPGRYDAPPNHPSSYSTHPYPVRYDPPSRHATYPAGRHEFPPSDHLQDHHRRPRHHSMTGQEAPRPVPTSRYVKPHITKVPQKEEAIHLSWPLVDFASRSRTRPPKPAVYFDVGFDPRVDKLNVTANRGDHYSKLTEEESSTPASSHCVLIKMTIVCPLLAKWPIVVQRKEGLRCIDVFLAIYDTYEKFLTREDVEEVGEDYIKRCVPAFKQRCQDSPGLPLYNERCGMRRVDLLRGQRIFEGLVRDPTTATWTLNFHKPQPLSRGS